MARTVVIGDVHGCRNEVDALLDQIQATESDRIFFVGDLLSRGPDPLGVLEIFRETRARAVRGNHEQVILEWRNAAYRGIELPPLGHSHRKVAEQLSNEDWALLDALPF